MFKKTIIILFCLLFSYSFVSSAHSHHEHNHNEITHNETECESSHCSYVAFCEQMEKENSYEGMPQRTKICPHCKMIIPWRATVCGHCGRDVPLNALEEVDESIDKWAEENPAEALKTMIEINKRFEKREAKELHDQLDSFEKEYEDILTDLKGYYGSYDLSILNNIDSRLNSLKSRIKDYDTNNKRTQSFLVSGDSMSERYEQIHNWCTRMYSNIDDAHSAIDKAKRYVPDNLKYQEFNLIKRSNGYYLSIPETFSSSSLVIPASVIFNRNTVNVIGIDNENLSRFTQLQTIKYEGTVPIFDISQHNSCPNLKSVYLVNQTPPNTQGTVANGKYTIYIPDNTIKNYCKSQDWCKMSEYAIITERSGRYFAKGNVIYHPISNGSVEVCSYLLSATSFSIPETVNGMKVTTIGEKAFENKKLSSIIIPATVVSIGSRAFAGNNYLKQIRLPDSVKSIGDDAFAGCSALEDVVVEGMTPPSLGRNSIPSNTWISVGDAFNSYISQSVLPSNLCIRDFNTPVHFAYDGKNIYELNETTHIAALVKGRNDSKVVLSSMVFNNQYALESIKEQSFKDCFNITEVIIPNTIESIGSDAFSGCSNLTLVVLSNADAPICDKPIFDKHNNIIVSVPNGSLKSYKKQKGWKSAKKIVEESSLSKTDNSFNKERTQGFLSADSKSKSQNLYGNFSKVFLGTRYGLGTTKGIEGVDKLSAGVYLDYLPSRFGAHFGVDYCFNYNDEDNLGYGFGFFAGPALRVTGPSSPIDLHLYAAPGYSAKSFGYDVGINLGWRNNHAFSLFDISAGYQNWGHGVSMGYIGLGTGLTLGGIAIALSIYLLDS